MYRNGFRNFSLIGVSLLMLGGCSNKDEILYHPSAIHSEPIQIIEGRFHDDVTVSQADERYISALAHRYARSGGSDMALTVTYDPQSSRNTAMKAGHVAAELAYQLRQSGVRHIETSLLPIKSQGDVSRVLTTYVSVQAKAPAGCDTMIPGLGGSDLRDDEDYKLGCSINSYVARQVSNPSDLLGRGAVGGNTDGRVATNVIDVLRSGEQNAPLEGESASGDGP